MKNKFGQEIELLAPAGNFDRMQVALHFGADAVYLGGKEFGLRAKSQNFDEDELKKAVDYAHGMGKRVYVTVNVFAKNADFPAVKKYAAFLQKTNVDAVIISDLGILKIFRENTNLEIHISTQANITNKFTAEQYVELGAKRIILARELPIDDIAEIAEYIYGRAVVEVFVHGAMCISYSGRCLLSNYLTGRESNRGDCSQPCRYSYALMEEKRAGEYYSIEQDDRGTYILNSRDLCLIDRLQELAAAGVASFKIEGRMKSEHYIGGAVNAYRRVMDGRKFNAYAELEKISHRPYTTGLAFASAETEFPRSAGQVQTHEIIAVAVGGDSGQDERHGDSRQKQCGAAGGISGKGERNERCRMCGTESKGNERSGQSTRYAAGEVNDGAENWVTVQQKNKFAVGDRAEILSPAETFNRTFIITEIDGETTAGTPNAIYRIKCPFALRPHDILRRRIHSADAEKKRLPPRPHTLRKKI